MLKNVVMLFDFLICNITLCFFDCGMLFSQEWGAQNWVEIKSFSQINILILVSIGF
jgi:hypothetical protein